MWLMASPAADLFPEGLASVGMRFAAALSGLAAAVLVTAACTGGGGDGERTGAEDGGAAIDDETPPPVQGWSTDWSNRTIALAELTVGIARSDPRDAIPPIDDPAFESVEEAGEWLAGREPVVALEIEGEARAYPLRILTSHEIVNDVVGEPAVAVTFCPLCNSAVAFDREVDGRVLRFGVSGLLRNSDLVMWDDATESLWQQITGEGVVGELAGESLKLIPASVVAWEDFRERFPGAMVLSRDQGIYPPELYANQPYEGYDTRPTPFLFAGEVDGRYPAMERVVAVRVDGESKAYPFSQIAEARAVNDNLSGTPLLVVYGAEDTVSVLDTSDVTSGRAVGVGLAFARTVDDRVLTFASIGDDRFRDEETGSVWDLFGEAIEGPLAGTQLTPLVSTNELWFAWAAFNPEAAVYTATASAPPSSTRY
jgi:hypothetical protein